MADENGYTIVIVGGGTAGWMSAAALARFVPPGHRIALVESDAIRTIGVGEATIPAIRTFNDALGIDETEFLRETRGSLKLGIAFEGWGTPDGQYMHAFGPIGRPLGLVHFKDHWARAWSAGFAKPLAHYSVNEIAARTMRAPDGGRGPAVPYAYHFDAGLYAGFLRRYAEARGVTRREGTVERVTRHGESGDIAAIVLGDGTEVAGDFFIDCTGFRGLLIEQELAAGYDDWSHWLPCDRAMAVPCAPAGGLTPYTRSIAREAGWQWRIPLQHRIGNGLVYCSEFLSDEDAAHMLLAHLDGEALGDPRPLRFVTGKRRKQWVANCLAVGLSSGFMEPLESTSIHMIQASITRFLTMLPRGDVDPAVRDEFNRAANFEQERIRDFLILHYKANGRTGEPFWDRCRAMEIPDTLAAKIDQFRGNGVFRQVHEELFTEDGWLQVFVGQGIEPDNWNAMADALPETKLREFLAVLEQAALDDVRRLPSHMDILARAMAEPEGVET
ncbi:tryptophan 7-halogenase [Qipengyuania sp. YG27]|uniref:Tryptophan 7-halogenase n=1 Tax=Qipengyuania mesophila TaxID=2867246 RepID=A0ABS7JXI1_9SPHN|nr:tryptophan halogenase family protein [Qipengyuania mesophila]MBX7502311.1 tryptophan 7-halogenase [Qipengyuania mesophila]